MPTCRFNKHFSIVRIALTVLLLPYCEPALAQSVCQDPCDLRVPSRDSIRRFQKQLDNATDANGDGEVRICLGRGAVIGDSYDSAQDMPTTVPSVIIKQSNVTIEGSTSEYSGFFMRSPALTKTYALIMVASGVRNFKLRNVNLTVTTGSSSSFALYSAGGSEVSEISNVNFYMQARCSSGIVSFGNAQARARLGTLSNLHFTFSPATAGLQLTCGWGIDAFKTDIDEISNTSFSNMGSAVPAEGGPTGISLNNTSVKLVQGASSDISNTGGIMDTGLFALESTITRVDGVSGNYRFGAVGFSGTRTSVGLLSNVDVVLHSGIPEWPSTGATVGASIVQEVRNFKVKGPRHDSLGFKVGAGSAVNRISGFEFSGQGSGIRLEGSSSVKEISDFSISTETLSGYGVFISPTATVKPTISSGTIITPNPSRQILSEGQAPCLFEVAND